MLSIILALATVATAFPYANPAPAPVAVAAAFPTGAGSVVAREPAPQITNAPSIAAAAKIFGRQRGGSSTGRGDSASRLADGIQSNIDIQVQELAGVQALSSMLADENQRMNTDAYLSTKTSVLKIQSMGTSIREENQRIAPPDNSAIPGLNMVKMAQEMEISQVEKLTGNRAEDTPLLNQLEVAVKEGTAQNAKNRYLALGSSLISMAGGSGSSSTSSSSSSSSSTGPASSTSTGFTF